ncbi:TetR/AcrR family transcriptional regulator [bacterium]|nr:TetR/AcrR family transcriptional regulator [bacterium]
MPKAKIDRKTLLRNALSVFKVKGYSASSMQDLASANGILKGSMYHYVESKEALMIEVLNALKDHYVAKVFAKAYDDDLAPVERLKELARRSEEIFMYEEGGDFFVNIGLETKQSVPVFAEIIKTFFEEWIRTLKHLYSFVTNEKEAMEKAELAVAEIEGSVILMRLLDDPMYLQRTNKKLIEDFNRLALENPENKLKY